MMEKRPEITRITVSKAFERPPLWAILERQLIDLMNQSAEPVFEKYVRPDGSLLWPVNDQYVGIDALDDAYESFHNWPLFYMVGGDEQFRELSQREWEAITRQFEKYDCGHGHPMVVKEYEQGYDWFHQGEGYLFFYLLGMAAPNHPQNAERARRFAGFYLNEDPQALNYDETLKLVRCAFVGSMGPAYRNFDQTNWGWADWKKHYGLPFQDVPGVTSLEAIKDRRNAEAMGQVMRQRMSRGDVATNLAIVGMMTHAYLHTGESKYQDWVKEYVEAWMRRAQENGGIVPDNVGPTGKIGETMDGKWYGGYYGWTWPHGWGSLGDAVVLAAEDAALLSGDRRYLDFPRWQIDALIRHGVEAFGTLHVPYKFGDPGWYEYGQWVENVLTEDLQLNGLGKSNQLLWRDGWFEFQPLHPKYLAHLWNLSHAPEDLERLHKTRNHRIRDWAQVVDTHEKDQGGHDGAWVAYLNGEFPNYPEEILKYNLAQVYRRLAFMRQDTQDPQTYGDYYLQQRNPITMEGLVQLTMGGPLPLYNGGHLMTSLRYFDAAARRPGLPPDVGALVEQMSEERVVVRLVNLSATQVRKMIVQAGAYGEHQFVEAVEKTESEGALPSRPRPIQQPFFALEILPGSEIALELTLKRFANTPSYALPWDR